MLAAEEREAVAVVEPQGEAPGGDTVGGIHGRLVGDASAVMDEVTEEGRAVAVVLAEAVDEAGVGDEKAPALADEGGAGEGGWQRGKAEEDFGE